METLLNNVEIRVLGSLMEKELTTPEYYPLTLNALVNACNQKSNRDPVVNYDDSIVDKALATLRDKQFARRVTGTDMRVPKYKQIFSEEMKFTPAENAVMCVLMLRGPQTFGEIKGRTGRMFNFESLLQVEDVIEGLNKRENPLVMKLPKQTGMKESRYAHLLAGKPVIQLESDPSEEVKIEEDRLTKLELELSALKLDFDELKSQFIDLKKLFE
jgi:hypothetical protein